MMKTKSIKIRVHKDLMGQFWFDLISNAYESAGYITAEEATE